MPNVSEKKKKLLCLARILLTKTDGEHALSLPELLACLEAEGIFAERKSIYDDIETLRSVGLAIETRKTKSFQYYIEKRTFSEEELRKIRTLLFYSGERKLAEKLLTLCSDYQAEALRAEAVSEHPAPEQPTQERIAQGQAAKEPNAEKALNHGRELTLEFSAKMLPVVEERFGGGLSTESAGKNKLRATVLGEAGPELFAWLFIQAAEVRLVSPKKLCEQLREQAKAVAKLYKN